MFQSREFVFTAMFVTLRVMTLASVRADWNAYLTRCLACIPYKHHICKYWYQPIFSKCRQHMFIMHNAQTGCMTYVILLNTLLILCKWSLVSQSIQTSYICKYWYQPISTKYYRQHMFIMHNAQTGFMTCVILLNKYLINT